MQLPTGKMEKKRKNKRVAEVSVNEDADMSDIEISNEEGNSQDDDSIHSDTTYDDINNNDSDDDKEVPSDAEVSGSAPTGMADVISKLLRKSVPKGKTPILCKAITERELEKRKRKLDEKKGSGIVEVKQEGGEIKSSDDEILAANEDHSEVEDDKEKIKKLKIQTHAEQQKKKKEWEDMGRVKPSVLDRETERSLQRIATKGVVQLFNAVKKQQTLNEEKSTDSTALSAKAKCGQFLDMLQAKSKTKQKKEEMKDEEVKEEEDDSTWSILREDFMLGSNMKDWDKDVDVV